MNHFYVPRCVWAIGATAAIISCHSNDAECQCTAATFAVSASMFQVERMMTSLLAVMITFGTQAMGKLGKRLSGWQPLSVSCCHRERANARTSDASLHATVCLTAASAAQEPGRCQEGKVMGNVVFEWAAMSGIRTRWVMVCKHMIVIAISTRNTWTLEQLTRTSLNIMLLI